MVHIGSVAGGSRAGRRPWTNNHGNPKRQRGDPCDVRPWLTIRVSIMRGVAKSHAGEKSGLAIMAIELGQRSLAIDPLNFCRFQHQGQQQSPRVNTSLEEAERVECCGTELEP